MDWIKLDINIKPQSLELIAPFLFSLGAEGIEERTNRIAVYFKQSSWNKEIKDKLENLIKNRFPDMENIQISVYEIPTEPWNEKWKENFKPFKITENLMIYPDWEPVPVDKEFDTIIISPKMAFGTGHHETTQLILEIIPKYLSDTIQVLDAGTGSGILAIYCILKGAGHVTAYDFDPVATENATENIYLNHVDGKIKVITGELQDIPQKKYDLIVANINKNVLINIPEHLGRYISDSGVLIISGLLRDDFEQVVSVYNNKWNLVDQKAKNEWIALVFKPLID